MYHGRKGELALKDRKFEAAQENASLAMRFIYRVVPPLGSSGQRHARVCWKRVGLDR